MRPEVEKLVALGPLPTEAGYDEQRFQQYEQLIGALTRPATDEEAMALLQVFGPEDGDSCYGLAWRLVHFIETAPNWPAEPPDNAIASALEHELRRHHNPWVQFLWLRIMNAREYRERGCSDGLRR